MKKIVNKFLGENAYQQITRFMPYVKPFWKRGALACSLMIINTLLQSALPLVTMFVIDKVFTGQQVNLFVLICIGYLALNVFHSISTFLQGFFLIKIRNKIIFNIKLKLFEHLERQSLNFFHQKQSGYLTSRSQRDVDTLQGFMGETVLAYVMDIMTFCIGIVLIFWLQAKLAVIALCILPFYILTLRIFNKKLRDLSYESMEKVSKVYSETQEKFAGIYTIFSFCREKYEAMRFAKKLRESVRVQVKYEMVSLIAESAIMFIGSLGPLAIMYFGGREIIQGRMTIGEFVAFNAYIRYLFGPAQGITGLNLAIQASLAALGRIFELFDSKTEIQDPPSPVTLPGVPRQVVYSHVSFRYDKNQEHVLRDINFRISAGETYAIVGLSGAGKTTLVNLLPRFFDPEKGRILIDGIDIRDVSIRDLRQIIGIVPQDIFLFTGTIRENIGYGRRNATKEQIIQASKAANAHDFIMGLPEGYNTEVGERGVLLSGGEKQRIAIARAALKDPKILILDEATASLDSESESLIQAALKELAKDKASLVIAHRLSTILSATKILVLHEGKNIEMGNHAELYEQNGFYRNLYDTQFRKQDNKIVTET
jgi:subfamily B ATP-binding cassette protein MsbA